jgi:RES domain-containing protein
MHIYRFGLKKFISDLSGQGAKIYGGRWNAVGNAMLYSSYSPSLAMLEFACNASGITKTIQTSLLTLKLDSKVKIEIITLNDLPANWQQVPSPDSLKVIGNNWLKSNKTLALKVPSAIMPLECNLLINSLHKEFFKLEIENFVDMNIDSRILK